MAWEVAKFFDEMFFELINWLHNNINSNKKLAT